MRRALLVLLLASAGAAAPAAQAPAPAVVIEEPGPGVVLSGPSQLAATITPESDVRQVTFFVDGQPACRVQSPPFRCEWAAGQGSTARTVRVVADLTSGQLATSRLATKATGATEPITRISAHDT